METLSKVFEDKYNKNVKDCTNEEIYHGLLSWTKEQLKGRGYQEGKKKIYYICRVPYRKTSLQQPDQSRCL